MPKAKASSEAQRVREGLPVITALIGAVTLVIGLAILPTRTYLSQRSAKQDATERLDQLEQEVSALEARLRLLSTDSEVERLARKNYDLVYPGEESYRILPAD